MIQPYWFEKKDLELNPLPAIFGALINRANQGNGAPCFRSADAGWATFFDGFDDVFEIELVTEKVDCAGIIGSQAAAFGGGHEICLDVFVFGFGFGKIPDAEFFVGKKYGTLIAAEIHFAGVSG